MRGPATAGRPPNRPRHGRVTTGVAAVSNSGPTPEPVCDDGAISWTFLDTSHPATERASLSRASPSVLERAAESCARLPRLLPFDASRRRSCRRLARKWFSGEAASHHTMARGQPWASTASFWWVAVGI